MATPTSSPTLPSPPPPPLRPAADGHERPPMIPFRRAAASIRILRRHGDGAVVHAPKLHGHRFFVLFFADQGEGEIRFARKTEPVGPGHVHLLAPGELHDTSGLEGVTGWAVEFTEDVFGDAGALFSFVLPRPGQTHWIGFTRFETGAPACAVVAEDERAAWTLRFKRLARELRDLRLGYQEVAKALLQITLVDAARLLSPWRGTSALPALVTEVFDVIDARYAEPLSLQHVAAAVGRSPSHLTATVREATGLTVLEWINVRRMAEARRRLRDTDEDVAIIAERVGFHDSTYFIRQFRKSHEMTPRAWRMALTEGG